ncbi:response regulator transcription factor [Lentzea sp. BCCO 10_0061]|uniref:Response regulator transcription factor n=1 Tax=Lentzea sokolovensis TaxID=3095429 RepID=A0ABU4V7N5_9PSEU|nr:response regulator transcription factor [Lentzea sp. BCCO 10_0061]MDX8146971.1 response regulator transcription factor [Lentzea sp. BCCO 10_0061]
MTIKVVVADDQAMVRAGFAAFLRAQPDIEVVAEAADGVSAVAAATEHRPDVVLMDIRMPEADGIEATRRITETFGSEVAVLILTTFDLDEYVYSALRAGASGFLLKDTDPEDLVAAVRVIAAGEALLAPTVTKRLIREFTSAPVRTVLLAELTKRENEIMVLVARGLANNEIADKLFLSATTVKTHVNRVMAKLGLNSRAQVVAAAYEAGLVIPARTAD